MEGIALAGSGVFSWSTAPGVPTKQMNDFWQGFITGIGATIATHFLVFLIIAVIAFISIIRNGPWGF